MNDNYQQLYIILYATIILIIIHCNNLNNLNKKKFKKPSKEILTNRIDITNKEKLLSYILNVKILYFYCIKYAHKTYS